MEKWQELELYRRLRIIKYLISRADVKGMTHGEKHHLLEVAAMELNEALHTVDPSLHSALERNVTPDVPPTDEIPF